MKTHAIRAAIILGVSLVMGLAGIVVYAVGHLAISFIAWDFLPIEWPLLRLLFILPFITVFFIGVFSYNELEV